MRYFVVVILFSSALVCSVGRLLAGELDQQRFEPFVTTSSDSSFSFDFSPVDELLNAVVLDMGLSDRAFAEKMAPKIGTRFSQFVNVRTGNEGNRIAYELLKHDEYLAKLELIKGYLEQQPTMMPLSEYPRGEQLAYWVNLHNITLIYEIAKNYPIANLKGFLQGPDSALNRTLVRLQGEALSLNDIHYVILSYISNNDPLVIYGLYQGTIGGPNIRKQAYTGKNVYRLLEKNAVEFINSNRGTMKDGGDRVLVSSCYEDNAAFFNHSEEELRSHLLKYAKGEMRRAIKESDQIVPEITDWSVTDLYGTFRKFGQGSSTNSAGLLSTQLSSNGLSYKVENTARHLSREQILRLKELMVVRARNFGGTSVTVTDLPPDR